jgi:hypothetical protein
VREPAALDLLTGLGVQGAPELLAVAAEPALVVMQDLGTSAVSLADLLLGSDPDAASDGLIAWASTMGALHVQTAAAGEAFAAALAAHGTRLDAPAPPGDDMPAMLGSVAGKLPGRLSDLLGVAMPAAAAEEVRSLADLLPAGAAGALTPADACPDNNSLQPGGMVLFDFEEAAYRHVAWDAAYLVAPWPTCWCSWPVPDSATAPALARWRELAETALPRVATTEFEADLSAALAGWTASSLSWFLPRAVEERRGDPVAARDLSMPGGRALLLYRLRLAVERPDPRLPALTDLFAATLAAALTAWGDLELAPAPAFRPAPRATTRSPV